MFASFLTSPIGFEPPHLVFSNNNFICVASKEEEEEDKEEEQRDGRRGGHDKQDAVSRSRFILK